MAINLDRQGARIGRATDNDWVLADPDKYISSHHASIEFRNNSYYITDTSSNGVFMPPSEVPLGRNNKVALRDGDQLGIGEYQIKVSVTADEFLTPKRASDAFKGSPKNIDVEQDPFMDLGANPIANMIDDADNLTDDFSTPEADFDDDFFATPSSASADKMVAVESNHVPTLDEAFSPASGSEDSSFPSFEEIPETPQPGSNAQAGLLPENWFDDDEPELNPFAPAPAATPSPAIPDVAPIKTPKLPITSAELDVSPVAPDAPTVLDVSAVPPTPVAQDLSPVAPSASTLDLSPESLSTDSAIHKPKPAAPRPAPEPSDIAPAAPVKSVDNQAPGVNQDIIQRFCQGAGIEDELARQLTPDTFYNVGQMLRIAVQGTMDVLLTRTKIKNEMRLDVTTIRAAENNPIKFSISSDEALERLLEKEEHGGYMEPVEALEEAFNDIKAHQMAVIAGMQIALQSVLKRFDPERLEARLQKQSPISASIPIHKQAKLWSQFEQLYEDIETEAQDDFNRLFGHAFASAYEQQVQQLKSAQPLVNDE